MGSMEAQCIDTGIPNFQIRWARPNDVPLILQFVRHLAEFERLSHECVATEESLHETLFAGHPFAEVILGFYDGVPIGFALFFHNYSTFLARPGIYLEDLFVEPEWRGRGFGRELLIHVSRIAVERKCGRLEWSVLDWNVNAIRFYERLGAVAMNEWTTFRVSGEALEKMANEKVDQVSR